MFCFFCCFSDLDAVGDGERFRLAEGAAAESEAEVEVDVRLVPAVEGFWADVAWRVSLESLGVCQDLGAGFGGNFDVIFVGSGGLEKSISLESLLDELVSEVSEDGDIGLASVDAFAGFVRGLSDSSSDDELSEEDDVASSDVRGFTGAATGF